MSFKSKSKELIEAFLILTSQKETSERKRHVSRNLKSGFVFTSLGLILNPKNSETIINSLNAHAGSFDVDGYMSPLDAITKGLELGGGDLTSTLLFSASAYCFSASVSSNFTTPEKDRLIEYGVGVCPYSTYVDFKNDFRSKFVYRFANKVELMAYSREKESFFRNSLMAVKNVALKTAPNILMKHRKIMEVIGRPDLGYLTLVHHNKKYNNPKFANQLIIPKELKEQIREDVMDVDCLDRLESRTFTQDVIKESTNNIKGEVEERNVNLALVRLIDDIKMEKISNKRASIIFEDLKVISKVSSSKEKSNYDDLSKLVEYLFFDKNIGNLDIKNYNNRQGLMTRAYHIMVELDRICHQELKISPLKKPLSYREIVANETVMSVQRKLRGVHAEDAIHNKKEQDSSPLYKSHYLRNKELRRTMDNNRYGNNKNGFYKLVSRKNFRICGYDSDKIKKERIKQRDKRKRP